MSIKRNKLLEEQLEYTRLEVYQNIKGKKIALLAQTSDLLSKERLALRNFRTQLQYDTDGSEAEEMKASIIYYKKSVQDAKRALEEGAAVRRAASSVDFSSPTSTMSAATHGTSGTAESRGVLAASTELMAALVAADGESRAASAGSTESSTDDELMETLAATAESIVGYGVV